jgi:hypothetical protein
MYFVRHSGMVRDDKIDIHFCAEHQTRNLEISGSMLRIAPE